MASKAHTQCSTGSRCYRRTDKLRLERELSERERLALSDAQRSQFAFLRGEELHALARFSEAESHFKECMRLNGIERPQTPLRMRLSTLGQVGRQAVHRFGLMRPPREAATLPSSR